MPLAQPHDDQLSPVLHRLAPRRPLLPRRPRRPHLVRVGIPDQPVLVAAQAVAQEAQARRRVVRLVRRGRAGPRRGVVERERQRGARRGRRRSRWDGDPAHGARRRAAVQRGRERGRRRRRGLGREREQQEPEPAAAAGEEGREEGRQEGQEGQEAGQEGQGGKGGAEEQEGKGQGRALSCESERP